MHIVFDRCLCTILCAHEVLRCAAMRGVCVCVYLSRGGRISEVGGVLWHCKEGRILGFFHPSAYTMSPWMSRETKLSLWSISHFSWILFSSFEYALYSAMVGVWDWEAGGNEQRCYNKWYRRPSWWGIWNRVHQGEHNLNVGLIFGDDVLHKFRKLE